MISAELQAWKDMFRQGKDATPAGVYPPAEMQPQLRAGNDAIVDSIPADNPLISDVSIEAGELGGTPGEWARVADAPTDKVLLYFHGGGFENGSVKSRRLASVGIAKVAGMDSFSLDYTQWPEGKHPVALNQAVAAYRDLVREHGVENVYMGGESAGAILTLTACNWLRDHGEQLPAKILAIGPVIEIAEELPSRMGNEDIDPMLHYDVNRQMLMRYFEGSDPKSPYVSARRSGFEGFPPTMITVGTDEILIDDARILHEMLDEAGVENVFRVYEGAFHTFQLLPSPESFASIQELGEFLKA